MISTCPLTVGLPVSIFCIYIQVIDGNWSHEPNTQLLQIILQCWAHVPPFQKISSDSLTLGCASLGAFAQWAQVAVLQRAVSIIASSAAGGNQLKKVLLRHEAPRKCPTSWKHINEQNQTCHTLYSWLHCESVFTQLTLQVQCTKSALGRDLRPARAECLSPLHPTSLQTGSRALCFYTSLGSPQGNVNHC